MLLKDSSFKAHEGPYLLRPGIYFLPQDRTVCLVPQTKNIATIPNPALGLQPPVAGRMPNAAQQPMALDATK